MGRFQDRVVVVTGSSSGIGEAAARAFDAEGAHVVVNSSSSVEAGTAIASSLRSGHYLRADVSDADDCAALIDGTVDRFGRLDVLVNNAGVTQLIPHHDLDAVTDEVFRRILEVNVLGTFRLCRLAMPHLRAAGDAAIVNVTSVAGVRPTGSSVPYAASKAALNHLTALLGNVTGPEVRVNAVAPGLVRTPWTADWGPIHDAMATRAPLGRSAEPQDIAMAIVDVAATPYMTGQVVVVDGGLTLR
ncbi:MAG TPA: SDR family oxidoreductase [Acidimicrobiales bacterium]|nr:SDR family oxidoreductase [Acidimicrobiales bacterium]